MLYNNALHHCCHTILDFFRVDVYLGAQGHTEREIIYTWTWGWYRNPLGTVAITDPAGHVCGNGNGGGCPSIDTGTIR
ncbi:MAG: hypothetical protein JO297_15365 [Nitrososphaeraceae archaeon]|nr:hypothetical protein [Nitrososphaeraceae archaeon]